MPQDVDLSLPWPLRVNPHMDVAREHNIAWMLRFGLLGDQESVDAYLGWRLAEAAAYFYPEASPEGLNLATDLMGWFFIPFDDQFDGPLGRDPHAVAGICQSLTGLLTPSAGRPPAFPTAVALSDIWARTVQGASPAWRARTLYHWSEYFSVYVTEALSRRAGSSTMGEEEYLWRRCRSTAAYLINDLAERVSGFEVPPMAWYNHALHQLRQAAAAVVSLSNDTTSVEKEEAVGDVPNNLILVLEQREGLSRPEALAEIQRRISRHVERFLGLEEEAARLCALLGEQDSGAVRRYVGVLQDWMRGNDEWGRTTSRYARGAERDRILVHPQWARKHLIETG